MSKVCPKCGMQSERDDLCTWCNADLRQPGVKGGALPAKPGPTGAAPAPAAAAARREVAEVEERPARPGWLIPAVSAGSALVLLVVALTVVGVLASGPPPAPGDWQSLAAKDSSLTASYPAGWGVPTSSGSAGSYVMVDWRPTKLCHIGLQGTQAAGAIGDTAAALERAAGGDVSAPVSADGAVLAHFLTATSFKKSRPGYAEGTPEYDTAFAGTRSVRVEYSYSRRAGILPIKIKGVRWGHFQGDYGYNVWAEAPEKHWAAFEPTALAIVASVKLGAKG